MTTQNIAFAFVPYTLHFKEPGMTSRGILKHKLTYLLKGWIKENPKIVAYGEVPIFPGLSKESPDELEAALKELCITGDYRAVLENHNFSSLRFGIEQVLHSLANDNNIIFPSAFTSGNAWITINGLVWMGAFHKMKKRVIEKLEDGFECIKIKIAAINWEEELELIRFIRDTYGYGVIIRVDANGGFSPQECLLKLEELSKYEIHSIEQPIKPGSYPEMRKICSESPIPVALDEDLIGIGPGDIRSEILSYILPEYIILKPALCYGFTGASDWIKRAKKMNISFWITSALESSVGLNAIAQFTGTLNPEIPQGLGTGHLFVNNFESPLVLDRENLNYIPETVSYESELEKLKWRN